MILGQSFGGLKLERINQITVAWLIANMKNLLTKDNILDKFQDAFHERAFGKIIELGCLVAKNVVQHKLGLGQNQLGIEYFPISGNSGFYNISIVTLSGNTYYGQFVIQ